MDHGGVRLRRGEKVRCTRSVRGRSMMRLGSVYGIAATSHRPRSFSPASSRRRVLKDDEAGHSTEGGPFTPVLAFRKMRLR